MSAFKRNVRRNRCIMKKKNVKTFAKSHIARYSQTLVAPNVTFTIITPIREFTRRTNCTSSATPPVLTAYIPRKKKEMRETRGRNKFSQISSRVEPQTFA